MKSWLDKQVQIYSSHSDNYGVPATYRHILSEAVHEVHTYWDDKARFVAGPECDFSLIQELRSLPKGHPLYTAYKNEIKAALQCYTPAAMLKCKKKGNVILLERTGIMQLDFDYKDIKDYDVKDLKQCVFDLPFIGYCGLSCSGDGFYALALISEPEKLAEYAEHCFEVFADYGIQADRSKGKKIENLRYLSYDANALIRENPTPLVVKTFRTAKKVAEKKQMHIVKGGAAYSGTSKIAAEGLAQIQSAVTGTRWATVQKVAYTLGGLGEPALLSDIKEAINNNTQFSGEEDKYSTCAEVCFKAGQDTPLKKIAA